MFVALEATAGIHAESGGGRVAPSPLSLSHHPARVHGGNMASVRRITTSSLSRRWPLIDLALDRGIAFPRGPNGTREYRRPRLSRVQGLHAVLAHTTTDDVGLHLFI